jgi:hypothetical protein
MDKDTGLKQQRSEQRSNERTCGGVTVEAGAHSLKQMKPSTEGMLHPDAT